MLLEEEILKEFSEIRELQYESFPDMRSSDLSTYENLKKTPWIKIFIKKLLNIFSFPIAEKKYFVLGIREKEFLSCLPKHSTVVIVQSFKEAIFALRNGFDFIYFGLINYSLIRAFFEKKPQYLKEIVKNASRILLLSAHPSLIIYFNDVKPMEVLFRRVATNLDKKITTVCGQHGLLLDTDKEDFIFEGEYSKYFLAIGNSQKKIAQEKFGSKTKIINLGPLKCLSELDPFNIVEVILVSNGGADVDEARSKLTTKLILNLSRILEKYSIGHKIKPHPSEDLSVYSKSNKVFLGDKSELLTKKPRVFIGFVSTLLYEAHVIGHTTIEIKFRKKGFNLNHHQSNTFITDHSFYEDQLEEISNTLISMKEVQRNETDSYYFEPLKNRVLSSLAKIERDSLSLEEND
jgi:hypothetical protein